MTERNERSDRPAPESDPGEKGPNNEETYLAALYELTRSEKVVFTPEELDEIYADPVSLGDVLRKLTHDRKAG